MLAAAPASSRGARFEAYEDGYRGRALSVPRIHSSRTLHGWVSQSRMVSSLTCGRDRNGRPVRNDRAVTRPQGASHRHDIPWQDGPSGPMRSTAPDRGQSRRRVARNARRLEGVEAVGPSSPRTMRSRLLSRADVHARRGFAHGTRWRPASGALRDEIGCAPRSSRGAVRLGCVSRLGFGSEEPSRLPWMESSGIQASGHGGRPNGDRPRGLGWSRLGWVGRTPAGMANGVTSVVETQGYRLAVSLHPGRLDGED